jgi:hypothetical protein
VSERIDDLMERMERLTEAPGRTWKFLLRRYPNAKVGVFAILNEDHDYISVASDNHPTLRAALEDALTQAEKAVADAY